MPKTYYGKVVDKDDTGYNTMTKLTGSRSSNIFNNIKYVGKDICWTDGNGATHTVSKVTGYGIVLSGALPTDICILYNTETNKNNWKNLFTKHKRAVKDNKNIKPTYDFFTDNW